MHWPFRRLISGLMMALLLLTGQEVTSARGTGPAVMSAVLCIGGGLVTVQLDANGNPVGAAHICPDATLAFPPDLAAPAPGTVPVVVSQLDHAPEMVVSAPATRPHLPPATGPPWTV